ncbi:hypothetical protein PAMH19_0951 [Pseudomonas aeruginosa]|nr:hypothetical protein PAMH19_0951 [Pseudomonas aeruginosa]
MKNDEIRNGQARAAKSLKKEFRDKLKLSPEK